MKYLTPLFLVSLLLLGMAPHRTHQATYKLKNEGEQLQLTVLLDRHEIEHREAHGKPFSALATGQYILEHFSCRADGDLLDFGFDRAETGDHFTYLNFTAKAPPQRMKTLSIGLDAFLDVADNFVNLVEFTIDGVFKSYTMDKNRQSIEVSFW